MTDRRQSTLRTREEATLAEQAERLHHGAHDRTGAIPTPWRKWVARLRAV